MLKRKTPLKAKSGIGGGKQKEVDSEYKQWKRERLPHHNHTPTKADRAEFPAKVVKQAKERAGGLCEACKARPDTESHHVMPKGGRSGRGVLSNLLRLCHECHREIQTNEELLQQWITYYSLRFGPRFWYDEQDWEEYNAKEAKQQAEEQAKQQRLNELEPVITLLSAATGRKLNSREIRLIDNMDDREMNVFAKLIADIVKAGPQEVFGYGEQFND